MKLVPLSFSNNCHFYGNAEGHCHAEICLDYVVPLRGNCNATAYEDILHSCVCAIYSEFTQNIHASNFCYSSSSSYYYYVFWTVSSSKYNLSCHPSLCDLFILFIKCIFNICDQVRNAALGLVNKKLLFSRLGVYQCLYLCMFTALDICVFIQILTRSGRSKSSWYWAFQNLNIKLF